MRDYEPEINIENIIPNEDDVQVRLDVTREAPISEDLPNRLFAFAGDMATMH